MESFLRYAVVETHCKTREGQQHKTTSHYVTLYLCFGFCLEFCSEQKTGDFHSSSSHLIDSSVSEGEAASHQYWDVSAGDKSEPPVPASGDLVKNKKA